MSKNWCFNCGNEIAEDKTFCSDNCEKELEKEREEERLAYEEEENKKNSILSELKSLLSDEDYEELLSMLEDSNNSDFEITDTPKSTDYNEKVFGGKYNEFVTQYSYGESGDSWHGIVSIELPNGKYFNYYYDS